MTAANLAKRRAAHMERIKQRWKARYYGLRFRRRFVDAEFEDEFERGLIHRRIAERMSQCGQCAALFDVASSSPRGFVASFGVWVFWLAMKGRMFIRTKRARERAIVGNGAALLRFPKSRKGVFVSARVNGIEARFLVDTGAMATFLPDDLARRANIVETGGEREVRLADGGKMRMKAARAETIMVQNANVRNLEVMICTPKAATSWGEGGAGILGMTFLEHFDMRICNGVLELKPLGAK